jgi:O-methyltransferase
MIPMTKCECQPYIDLLKRCVTRTIFPDQRFEQDGTYRLLPFDFDQRKYGWDWPSEAVTMVGLERLSALERFVKELSADTVPGDLVECGVWRGGCSIFMKGLLRALGDDSRLVWLFDSFEGLPKPADASDCDLSMYNSYLGVSLEQVQENFRMFDLLDDRVRFVRGWFKDTLPVAQVGSIALLRLDAKMYESTMMALDSLYDRVSPGGYIVIDDYGAIPQCQQAVNDFRSRRGITNHIFLIDWTGAYWRE